MYTRVNMLERVFVVDVLIFFLVVFGGFECKKWSVSAVEQLALLSSLVAVCCKQGGKKTC